MFVFLLYMYLYFSNSMLPRKITWHFLADSQVWLFHILLDLFKYLSNMNYYGTLFYAFKNYLFLFVILSPWVQRRFHSKLSWNGIIHFFHTLNNGKLIFAKLKCENTINSKRSMLIYIPIYFWKCLQVREIKKIYLFIRDSLN